jgi:hypothetical protein
MYVSNKRLRDDYWYELERRDARDKRFKEKFNGPSFIFAILFTTIICCPCICFNSIKNKIYPEEAFHSNSEVD